MMVREHWKTFHPSFDSVKDARHFALGAMDRWGIDCEDLALVVSELATNAVRYAGGSFDVTIHRDSSSVLVEVGDRSSSRPAVRDPGPDSPRGRGLIIIDSVARDWGVRDRSEGKVVWVRLPLTLQGH